MTLSSAEGMSIDLMSLGYNIDRHYITCKEGQRDYEENGQPQYFLNGDKMPDGMYMENPSENDFWDKDPSHITELLNNGKSEIAVVERCIEKNTELERKPITDYMSDDYIEIYNNALHSGNYQGCITMLRYVESLMNQVTTDKNKELILRGKI